MEQYMNHSVQRALSIIEAVGKRGAAMNLKEISDAVGLHKSTVHRFALTLEAEGWLMRADDGRYLLGLKLLTFSRFAKSEISSVKYIKPILQELCKKLDEQVILSVWDGKNVICIEKLESTQRIQVYSEIGRAFPIYAGGTGFALLIGMPEDAAREIIYGRELAAFTKDTLTDPEKIMERYRLSKKQGHVVSIGQVDRGVAGIGVPIYMPYEKTYGSIGVVLPEARTTEEVKERIIESLKEAVEKIQRKIGGINFESGSCNP